MIPNDVVALGPFIAAVVVALAVLVVDLVAPGPARAGARGQPRRAGDRRGAHDPRPGRLAGDDGDRRA